MKMILEDHNFGLTALMLSNNYIDDEEIQNVNNNFEIEQTYVVGNKTASQKK